MTMPTDSAVNAVYWIRRPDHDDIRCQGYVGVTKRFDRRLFEHKTLRQNIHLTRAIAKYGWDNLVKEKIVLASEEYCLEVEQKLRPEDRIGWNLVKGGGKPPSSLGKKYVRVASAWNKGISVPFSTKEKISEKIKLLWGNPEYRKHMSEAHKGNPSGAKGKKHTPEALERMRQIKLGKKASEETKQKMSAVRRGRKMATIVCPYCDKVGGIGAMKRWHMNNCLHKEVAQ
jgi:predicted GIY-YIG superfamily endonuclease